MRRMKKGEDIIKEPWQEIHDIPGYHDARNVAAFYPLKGEPNILPILEELAIEGRLLLPKSEGDGIMHFYKISNLKKDLVKGHYGIMEPREGIEKFEGDIPVFLVPGVKFNRTAAGRDTARVTTTGSLQSTPIHSRRAS